MRKGKKFLNLIIVRLLEIYVQLQVTFTRILHTLSALNFWELPRLAKNCFNQNRNTRMPITKVVTYPTTVSICGLNTWSTPLICLLSLRGYLEQRIGSVLHELRSRRVIPWTPHLGVMELKNPVIIQSA